MRTTKQLLSLALGTAAYAEPTRITTADDTCFDIFEIELPVKDFRGLPPHWTVFVLQPEKANKREWRPDRVISEATGLIGRFADEGPILIVSDTSTVHLGDEFDRDPKSVFSVDAPNLPSKAEATTNTRFSPFVLALQRKGLARLNFLETFMPYIKGKPALGWKFYGRNRELKKLIDTDENYMIVAGRRLGKTSLMLETERSLKERGEDVFYVNVQQRTKANEVAGDLLRALSPKDANYAIRHGEALGDRPLSIALKRLASAKRRTTLLIDELGNVIVKSPADDWSFVGLLRSYSQSGNLRVIISCFQEVFIKQQEEFEGPLVNFANVLRLPIFTDTEVSEAFLSPFEFWMNLQPVERRELRSLVGSVVGGHPYFLQYFCSQLFEKMGEEGSGGLMENAKKLVRADLVKCFESPQEEVFYHHGGSTLFSYVFLTRCKEADDTGKESLINTVIDDDWLEKLLVREGFSSTLASRRNILEGLEICGLSASVDGARSRQRISTPIVYLYVKRVEAPIEKYLEKLKRDVRAEAISWGLGDL